MQLVKFFFVATILSFYSLGCFEANAQVNHSANFDGCEVNSTQFTQATCQGWVTALTGSGFSGTSGSGYSPCTNSSAKLQLIGGAAGVSSASLTSSSPVGVSNGGPVSLQFNYKIRSYTGGGNVSIGFASIHVSYSTVSATGPWIPANSFLHSNSPSCQPAPLTSFTPPPGNLYIRITVNRSAGTFWASIDDIVITQATPAACIAPATVAVNAVGTNSASISWSPSPSMPDFYEWQLRSRGLPSEGAGGFVQSGNTASNAIELSSLQTNTPYMLFVRSICGGTQSSWQVAVFRTLQGSTGNAPCIAWQKTLGGTSGDDGRGISKTSDGGYFVVGNAASDDVFLHSNNGSVDQWMFKLNALGDTVFTKTVGSSQYDASLQSLCAADGSMYAIGQVGGNGSYISNYNGGGRDAYLIKLNAVGDTIATRTIGGNNTDIAWSGHVNADNGLIVAGSSLSSNQWVHTNRGLDDFWAVRLNANLDTLWSRTYGGNGEDICYDVIQTTDGGFALVGYSSSNSQDVSGNHGGTDVWLVKLNAAGDTLWTKTYGGLDDDYGLRIKQTMDGGFIIGAASNSNSSDVYGHHGIHELSDTWIVKTNASGDIQWQRSLGGTSRENPNSNFRSFNIIQTSDGNYVSIGSTFSNDGDVSGLKGGEDIWINKLNAEGNIIWQRTIGSATTDRGYDIVENADGSLVICGIVSGANADIAAAIGSNDVWIAKLSEAACTVLPQKLLQISAMAYQQDSRIRWQVSNEVNVFQYQLEHSQSSSDFKPVASFAARNLTTLQDYAYTHSNPGLGKHFYRIKMLDADGSFTYSPIVSTSIGSDRSITLSPNPVLQKATLQFSSATNQPGSIAVYNSGGQQVGMNGLQAKKGINSMQQDFSALPPGTYRLQVRLTGGESYSLTFVK